MKIKIKHILNQQVINNNDAEILAIGKTHSIGKPHITLIFIDR